MSLSPSPSPAPAQLAAAVGRAFGASSTGQLRNEDLYSSVQAELGIPRDEFKARQPVGRARAPRCLYERQIRWTQQTLRQQGLLERVPGRRGLWRLTAAGQSQLTTPSPGVWLVAFSTKLGVAIWGDCRDVLARCGEPIHLVVTSPPYALRRPRAYGGPTHAEYVDFICAALEPVVRCLAPGGSIALNIGQDSFVAGSPARELIVERVAIALHDRLGLEKMDTLIWHNKNRPPAPLQWASRTRQQLNAGFEPILWFSNSAALCLADNRRVLQPHTERHKALIAGGGEKHGRINSDGAYRVRPGAYATPTPGRIPRNVLEISGNCSSQRAYKRLAREAGLPVHGAPFPLDLCRFLVEFLSPPGGTVADIMSGSGTLPLAAEEAGRPWLSIERVGEYVAGQALRFEHVTPARAFSQLFPMPGPQQRLLGPAT